MYSQHARTASSHRLTQITIAIHLICASMATVICTSPASAQSAKAQYNIPAGPLSEALSRFAQQAGVAISFDAGILKGIQTEGLQGSYAVDEGFSHLLRQTGYAVGRTAAGYVLQVLPSTQHTPAIQIDAVLPAIQVSGSHLENPAGPMHGYVATRANTGTKTNTALIEIPQSISIVTRDQMDAQNVQTVGEALRYTAGVIADSNGPDPRSDNLVIRGLSSNGSESYRDGLRSFAFNNQGGTVMETYGLERIEVMRGPSSILYGQGGAGGIVNYVTKRPTAETLRELQMQLGTYGRKQLAGDFSGKLSEDGRWTYRLTALARESDTFIDYVNDDRSYIAPALTWKPNADTSLTLLADYQMNRSGQGYQALPRIGTLVSNANGQIPTNRFLGEPGFDKHNQERKSIGYLFEHRFNEQLSFRQNARYQEIDTNANYIYMNSLRAGNRTVGRRASSNQEHITNASIDNQLQLNWQHGKVEHTTLFGFDFQNMDNEFTRYLSPNNAVADLNLYNPVYGLPLPALPMTGKQTQHLRQSGVYLQDQIKIDKTWVATLGLRHDSTEQKTNNLLNGSNTRQKDSATTGRVGLVYLAPMGFAPYISYSESFMPVVGTTFGGAQFKPENGKQKEIGLRYQPTASSVSITASIYDLTRQNLTTTDLANPGFRSQRGEVQSKGFELEAKASLARNWDIIASYAYGKVKLTQNNDGTQGNRLGDTPQTTASGWLQYTVTDGGLSGLAIALGVRYVGTRYFNDANTQLLPAYTLSDMAVHYDLARLGSGWKGWNVALNVSNIFDKTYIASCGYTGDACKYGYRRTGAATMTYRW
ncbi:TonB-dependent siderophore receptor [Herminiimonas sp. KBW02]|nr:TonB-dependent siderophore receptor [Herminiimonas sp. KBW02]